jgi:N6-L-threonylcarbamoyladenine synthase
LIYWLQSLQCHVITLGIETSCDETAIGIIEDSKVLANIVSSQIAHTKFGGVVPEIAARNHVKVIVPLTRSALEVARLKLDDIDLVSVTRGPGLIGALLVGLSYAKALAISLRKPLIGVNHLEGHIHTLQLTGGSLCYPYLALLVSGGHTQIILVEKPFSYRTVGQTLDDACGEAFDKVAKLLGLPYPGGPYIEKQAKTGRLGAVDFPVPHPKGMNFSYAGLKTAVLYYTRDNPGCNMNDVAANFQEAALEHLVEVVAKALRETGVDHLGLAGGVTVNRRLREKFAELAEEMGIALLLPDALYCTDNGVMIARAGAERFKRFGPSGLSVDAVAREKLENIL